jgi:hypothetical protein
MAFRKSSGKAGFVSPQDFGAKGIGQGDAKPGSSFRKSSKSGIISSPVEYKGKGMPSAIPVKHNRPAVLD